MYALYLTDVRVQRAMALSSRAAASSAKPVLRAERREQLESALRVLAVKPYRQRIKGMRDHMGRPVPPLEKHFKKGSPLEFCLPPGDLTDIPESLRPIRQIGDLDDWLVQTRQRWEREVLTLPEVTGDPNDLGIPEEPEPNE